MPDGVAGPPDAEADGAAVPVLALAARRGRRAAVAAAAGQRRGRDEDGPEGGDGQRASHASVRAQQTERRLPACHSASWNHV